MHILELIVMLAVCGGSALGAYVATRRWPRLRYPLLTVGFVILWLNLLSYLMTDRFFMLFAESFATELLYACSFLLVGTLSARYLDTPPRRIMFLVFTIMLSFFTLADYIYLAVAAGMVKNLRGQVVAGVTRQSTSSSCVAASLATVLRRWGFEHTEGEVAYAARTTFRGTSLPRVPGVVREMGAAGKLQAKLIKTTWRELRLFDVPCLLSTGYCGIAHCSALIGLDEEWVVAGEPMAAAGLLRLKREKYTNEWHWTGYAVVIAPDFLHEFHPSDTGKRCDGLFESLKSLGYGGRNTETVKKFQAEHDIEPTGVLDWRTILALDTLTGPPDRPRLSTYAKSFEGIPEK